MPLTRQVSKFHMRQQDGWHETVWGACRGRECLSCLQLPLLVRAQRPRHDQVHPGACPRRAHVRGKAPAARRAGPSGPSGRGQHRVVHAATPPQPRARRRLALLLRIHALLSFRQRHHLRDAKMSPRLTYQVADTTPATMPQAVTHQLSQGDPWQGRGCHAIKRVTAFYTQLNSG